MIYRCCFGTALLALISLSFDDLQLYAIRHQNFSARVTTAKDIPQLLTKGGLSV
jgi:hypothetical protein